MCDGPPTRGQASGDPRIFVVGSINADVFAHVTRHPAPGETVLGSGGQIRPGGKGANQAVAAALAGAPVIMIGAVGRDAYGSSALTRLRDTCDVRWVRQIDGPTGMALITVAGSGENSIIVIPGANAMVGQQDLSRLDELGPDDILILQGEVPVQASAEAARIASSRGARVLLNLAPVTSFPPEVLRLADPLIVNEHEAAGALRILRGPCHPDWTAEKSIHELLAQGIPSVIVTLGEVGLLVGTSEVTHLPPKTVTAVDTTGAGDAFVGACAAALLTGKQLLEAAEEANLFAAQSVTRNGAQDSYPDWRVAPIGQVH